MRKVRGKDKKKRKRKKNAKGRGIKVFTFFLPVSYKLRLKKLTRLRFIKYYEDLYKKYGDIYMELINDNNYYYRIKNNKDVFLTQIRGYVPDLDVVKFRRFILYYSLNNPIETLPVELRAIKRFRIHKSLYGKGKYKIKHWEEIKHKIGGLFFIKHLFNENGELLIDNSKTIGRNILERFKEMVQSGLVNKQQLINELIYYLSFFDGELTEWRCKEV